MNCITREETNRLHDMKVCVVGCGGLGGYAIEELSRIGVGYITGVDPDAFDVTNLNRQILSNTYNIGTKKVHEADKRMRLVNPDVKFTPVTERLTDSNAHDILAGHNLVIDAVDNIAARFVLEGACRELGLPLVHGAIAGWYGQVSVIMPGDDSISKIYKDKDASGIESELGNPPFLPAIVASIEVSEAIKLLLNKGKILRNKLLYIDILNHSYEVLDI